MGTKRKRDEKSTQRTQSRPMTEEGRRKALEEHAKNPPKRRYHVITKEDMERRMKGTKKPVVTHGDLKKPSKGTKKPYNPIKDLQGTINKGIDDRIKNPGRQLINQGSGKAGQLVKRITGNDRLGKYASDELRKHGSRLFNEGLGKAKHWIHTEGKELVNHGIHHIKRKAEEFGGKVRDQFGRLIKKIKR